MTKYQVLQADRDSMRELLFYHSVESPKLAGRMLNGDSDVGVYVKVADVESDLDTLHASLDLCFLLTNSVDKGWWLNDGVTPTDAAKKGCRSTSVGDVIVTPDGQHYIVAPCGFEKVPAAS